MKGTRRQKVAKYRAEGLSQRKIAAKLGVSKSTIERDCKWLASQEADIRAEETAMVVAGTPEHRAIIDVEEIPDDKEERREWEKHKVIELVASRMTYKEVAEVMDVSVSTVVRRVNEYLGEYGDWGGRTMQEWRNEELIQIEIQMVELQDDMHCEPTKGQNAEGAEVWDMSPYQAAITRKGARKQYAELLRAKAQLLSLLVQRQEVDVQQTNYVVQLGGVDLSNWGPEIVEGTTVDGG
jgi:transposase